MVIDGRMVSVYPILLPVPLVSSWVSCSLSRLKCQKSGVVFVVLLAEIVYAEFLYVVLMFAHCDVYDLGRVFTKIYKKINLYIEKTLVQKFKKVHNALVATIPLYGSEF
jgi:hypothetical protein